LQLSGPLGPDLADGLTRSERLVLGVLTSAYVRSQDAVEGDPGLYEVLVRMAQSFAVRYPLVEGLGNFGNNDGWPAADIQYTQARLAPIAADAACFPLLLVNGAPGIPPHNLREVIAATLAYLDDPEIGVKQLLEHITGPDFPAGAILVNGEGLPATYAAGAGEIVLRAKAHIETGDPGPLIVVTELPFGVRKGGDGGVIDEIVELVRSRVLTGVLKPTRPTLGIRDESSGDEMRLVLKLVLGSDPEEMLQHFYELTQMQTSFAVRMLAHVDGREGVLTLRDVISEWVTARPRDRRPDAVQREVREVAARHGDARRTTIAM
jgi:DNA gyrase subunit A